MEYYNCDLCSKEVTKSTYDAYDMLCVDCYQRWLKGLKKIGVNK